MLQLFTASSIAAAFLPAQTRPPRLIDCHVHYNGDRALLPGATAAWNPDTSVLIRCLWTGGSGPDLPEPECARRISTAGQNREAWVRNRGWLFPFRPLEKVNWRCLSICDSREIDDQSSIHSEMIRGATILLQRDGHGPGGACCGNSPRSGSTADRQSQWSDQPPIRSTAGYAANR